MRAGHTFGLEKEKGEISFMEYRVMKGEIPVCETILDTSAEQPIDLDFSLPDVYKRQIRGKLCLISFIITDTAISVI